MFDKREIGRLLFSSFGELLFWKTGTTFAVFRGVINLPVSKDRLNSLARMSVYQAVLI